MTLSTKSLVELRGIAQLLDIPDIFSLDKPHLLQAIQQKQNDSIPSAPPTDIPKPNYDARLMTKAPASIGSKEDIEQLLQQYVARGLLLTFDEERWHMSLGQREDEGTLRMPLRTVLMCAEALFK